MKRRQSLLPVIFLAVFAAVAAVGFSITTATPVEIRHARQTLTGDTLPTDIYPGDTFIKTSSAAGFYYSVVRDAWTGPLPIATPTPWSGGTVANATTFSSTTTHNGAATFGSTTQFTGAETFNGVSTFNNSAHFSSSLNADGGIRLGYGSAIDNQNGDILLYWDNLTRVIKLGPVPSGSPAQTIIVQPRTTFAASSGDGITVTANAQLNGGLIVGSTALRARLDGGIDLAGGGGAGGVAFTSLPSVANGVIVWCNNCTEADPCATTGAGAFAKKMNSRWKCN